MKKLLSFLFAAGTIAGSAQAAGTYMGTSGYQSPQRYYSGGNSAGYYQPQYRGASGVTGNYAQGTPYKSTAQASTSIAATTKDGFYASAGLSHQYAHWNFDMNQAGSILDYPDIRWNVLDLVAGYKWGSFVFDGGFSYGMQSGEGKMTDDDISAGGLETPLYDSGTGDYVGSTYQKVFSVGDSKDGTLMGYHLGFGLRNMFGFGKLKITPSIGYRSFSYKLNVSGGTGISNASYWCQDMGDGQTYCPAIIWYDDGGSMTAEPDDYDGYYWWNVPAGGVSNGDTYSFSQTGKTHVYEVSWNGPFLALDFDSEINANNYVNARVELGFPGYTSEGDQPYRQDWDHPKSVEDTKDMFGATHLGLLTNWTTMVSNSFGITFGLTYDYYSVSDADVKNYLNGGFYEGILQDIFDAGVTNGDWTNDEAGQELMYTTDPTAMAIVGIYESCGDSWVCETKSEANSFYQSIGVRVGITGKF